MSKIRILLADDHMLMRMGISTLVSTAKDMTVVGEARNGREAVELAGSLAPDVVIMDLMMPEMSGGEATKAIHAAHPGIKIVILTTYGTSAELATAVLNGAVGVLLKDKVEMDLLNTIRFVIEGNQVIPTRLLAQIEEDKAMGKLTDRQMEILASVADGQSNADIAKQFGLSEITVKKHLSAIFERLGVANRSEAVALAFRKQMLKV
ncbi:MAG: response regulator transcription factor [Kiritimatiellae bacterium]|nr:response regulator transcription factor [Kiritimatiellia bacterium]